LSKKRNPNGMGNIKKRSDGRYEWQQTVDGQPRSVYARTPKELKIKIDSVADLPIVKENITVGSWFDKWLETYIKPLRKPATYNQYRTLFDKHIKPIIENYKLSSIKKHDVMKIIAEMNKNKLSYSTMSHVKKILHVGYNAAIESGLLKDNPIKNIPIPSKQAKQRKTLRANEVSELLGAMENSRWIHSVKFILLTGIRRGEMLALEWNDLDIRNNEFTVNKSLSDSELGETKSSKARTIPLSQKAIDCIEDQKIMLDREFNLVTLKKDVPQLVFPAKKGTAIKPHTYLQTIKRFGFKVGIEVTPHCLRHTYVYLTRGHLSVKELQGTLGHERSTTTLDIYGDILDSNVQIANKIDEAYGEILTKKEEGKIIKFTKTI
jgi:integrase